MLSTLPPPWFINSSSYKLCRECRSNGDLTLTWLPLFCSPMTYCSITIKTKGATFKTLKSAIACSGSLFFPKILCSSMTAILGTLFYVLAIQWKPPLLGVSTQYRFIPGANAARLLFLFLKANRTECSTTLKLKNCSSCYMFSVTFSYRPHTPDPLPVITRQTSNSKTAACCKSFVIIQPFGAGM